MSSSAPSHPPSSIPSSPLSQSPSPCSSFAMPPPSCQNRIVQPRITRLGPSCGWFSRGSLGRRLDRKMPPRIECKLSDFVMSMGCDASVAILPLAEHMVGIGAAASSRTLRRRAFQRLHRLTVCALFCCCYCSAVLLLMTRTTRITTAATTIFSYTLCSSLTITCNCPQPGGPRHNPRCCRISLGNFQTKNHHKERIV